VRSGGSELLNFCANNYLGPANDPSLVDAAKASFDEWGFWMASVRFICGAQTQDVALENRFSALLRQEVRPSSSPPASTPTTGVSSASRR